MRFVYGSLKFNWNTDIQICIAMDDIEVSKFNNIISKIIKKSLFTERQIEIILNQKDLLESKFSITKGAYYRQVGQSREKLIGLYYSIILLRGLGILLPDDIDVISKLSEQISVINESDIFPEREDEVISVIDRLVRQACNM
jgi:hypothetical protein